MRIVRCAVDGQARYGVVRDGQIHLLDRTPFPADGPDGSAGTAAPAETGKTLAVAGTPLLVPVEPSTIYAIGRNYSEHAKEMGFELGGTPSVFLKPIASLLPSGGTVVLPPADISTEVQHEAELVIVIGRPARNVTEADALSYVAGYTCADDVSARNLQRSDTNPTRGKGYDTFCPIGPWVETELDPSAVTVRCRVNGRLRQDGTTADLIYSVPFIISWISSWSTLMPGDVILTGSPAGTGDLVDGDSVEVEIGGVGTLTHRVRAAH
jgi:2-keto-4-pentenoate hydratase/2-oxohepta-3-ene-1,7-dioic acid hydratase in catechol pathway